MATTVARLLHVSDLHFGPRRNPALEPDPGLLAALRKMPWSDGLLAHDLQPLVALEEFATTGAGAGRDLLVTGDLTAVGARDEIRNASLLLLPFDPRWRSRAIAGNHDRWGGRPLQWVPAQPLLDLVLPGGPLSAVVLPLERAVGGVDRLRLFRLNTEADLPIQGGPERTLARGRFGRALRRASANLDETTDREIAVLAMHHSPVRPPRRAVGLLQTMVIDEASVTMLEDFCRRFRVRTILCGHTHRTTVEPWAIPEFGAPAWVACCGTTTQMQRDVPTALQRFVPARRPGRNELLLHDVEEREGRLRWVARAYEFSAEPYEFVPGMLRRPDGTLGPAEWSWSLT